MTKKHFNSKKLIFLFIIIFISTNEVFANQAYFDISDQEIEIQTNFKGKEVIIFGLTEPGLETILTIKGPDEYKKLQKKEKFFGIWINNNKIIYRNLPSIFFIASSSEINQILNEEIIINNSLYFDPMISNLMTQRNFNFNNGNNSKMWKNNLINIKKKTNFYKEYILRLIPIKN